MYQHTFSDAGKSSGNQGKVLLLFEAYLLVRKIYTYLSRKIKTIRGQRKAKHKDAVLARMVRDSFSEEAIFEL